LYHDTEYTEAIQRFQKYATDSGRMDEVKAARELVLCCWLPEGYDNE
jgi:hypothetical protein